MESQLRISEKEHAKDIIDHVSEKDDFRILTEYGPHPSGTGRIMVINIQIERYVGPGDKPKDDWTEEY